MPCSLSSMARRRKAIGRYSPAECTGAIKTPIQGRPEFAALMERGPRLDQRAGCFPGLDNDRSLGQRRHGDIAFGEEQAVLPIILAFIAPQWHLADNQVFARDFALQFGVLFRIDVRKGRADYRDGTQKSKPRCTGFQNETFFWKATSFFQALARCSCNVTDFGPRLGV